MARGVREKRLDASLAIIRTSAARRNICAVVEKRRRAKGEYKDCLIPGPGT